MTSIKSASLKQVVALFAATLASASSFAAQSTTITTTVTTSSNSSKVAAYAAKPSIAIPNAKTIGTPVAKPQAVAQPAPELRAPIAKPLPPLYRRAVVTIVPEGGAGVSGMSFSGNTDAGQTNSTTGYRGQVLAEIGRGVVSFQTGVMYQHEGVTTQNGDVTSAIGLDEFGLPLLAKFNMKGELQRRFTFKIGAIPMYASNITMSSLTNSTGKQIDNYSGTDGLRSVNVLAEAGLGFELPIARGNDVRIEVVYDHSTLPVNLAASSAQVYSQSVMVLLGFGLGT